MTGTILGVVLEVMAATVLIGGRSYARRARARVDKYGGWVGAKNYFSIAMFGFTLAIIGIFCFGQF